MSRLLPTLALVLAAAGGCAISMDTSGDTGDDGHGGAVDARGADPDPDAGAPIVDASAPLPDGASATGDCTHGSAGAAAYVPVDTMAPGTACGGCHIVIGKPLYISGTVYQGPHEADLCLGVTGVQVEITDSGGTPHLMPVNAAGNFVNNSLFELWPSPWTVAVVRGAARRPMVGTVTNGDCNSCHTAGGASGADGRILAP